MEKHYFQAGDYAVFISCLLLSLAIGLYYALTGGRQKTTNEFLMANRQMGCGPSSLSLLVTIMSAITVIGVPAEIFRHGTGYWMFAFSYFLFIPIVAHILIPVFYDMEITSVYEYLERRFSKSVRLCGTVSYLLMMIIYMGVVLYTPALAINAVTDINVWLSVTIMCVLCTIYTTLGGLKAVIWTDVFQALVMLISQIIIIVIGCSNVGGVGEVWKIGIESGKLAPINFDPSPLVPHTFWSLCIGGSFLCLSIYGVNQAAVQRFMCCKSKQQAQVTIYCNLPLLQLVMVIGCALGLVMLTEYRCENPLMFGAKPDQLLLYYVMSVLGSYPGIPGLIIACIFCASLSTVSSCFNSLATVTMQDIVRPHYHMTDRSATRLSKCLVVGYGTLCLLMTFIASHMGGVLIAALSILGILGGPVLSLFLLGMTCRRVNSTGALVGFIISMLVVCWIGFGSIAYRIYNPSTTPPSYYRSQDCLPLNQTTTHTTIAVTSSTHTTIAVTSSTAEWTSSPSPPPNELYTGINVIYKLSYMWYSGLSVLVSSIFAISVSCCTGSEPIEEVTLHPLVRTGGLLGPPISIDVKGKTPEEFSLRGSEAPDPVSSSDVLPV